MLLVQSLLCSLLTTSCLAFFSFPWKRNNRAFSGSSLSEESNQIQFLTRNKSHPKMFGPLISMKGISDWFTNFIGTPQKFKAPSSERPFSFPFGYNRMPSNKAPAVSIYKVQFKFPNIFKHFMQEEDKDEAKEECTKKGGKLVLGECYKYIKEENTYFDALVDCQSRGGRLWTPDLNNPFLLHFLAKELPEIVSGSEDRFWAGGYFRNNRVVTIEGEDITDSFAIHVDDADSSFDDNECLVIEMSNGGLFTGSWDCSNTLFSYVCEFSLRSSTEIVVLKKG